MKKVPLGQKRVKLSNHHDGIHDYGQKKEEDKAYDIKKYVEEANNNEKEKKIIIGKRRKEYTQTKLKRKNRRK